MGLRIDKDRRRLDYDLRLDDDRTGPAPAPTPSRTPTPTRTPAASRANDHDPAAVESAVAMKSAATSAAPGEAGRSRNQQNHDHQERDDRCLFHSGTTTNQPRPRTYIVSIPEGYQEFPVIPDRPPRPASLRT